MKNGLKDLNNILFEQLERLNDDELMEDPEKAKAERERAKAISGVSVNIVNAARLQLDAIKFQEEYQLDRKALPEVLQGKKEPPVLIGASNGI